MWNVLVTGANGFLGKELIAQLCSYKEYNVIAITSAVEKLREKFVGQECLNIYSLENFYNGDIDFSKVDYLVNCAFPRGEAGSDFARGIDYIEALLKKVAKYSLRGVIDISSQSVYSQKRLHAADEEEPICLESKYAVGKYMVEKLVDSYCGDIPHVHLRMASLIGKDFDVRIVNKLVKRAVRKEPIVIQGGSQCFGFLDVRDAADGIIQMLCTGKGATWNTVYNLGTMHSYTLDTIVETISLVGQEFGLELSVQCSMESAAWQNSGLDCTKFMEDFEWSPSYTLYDTIKEIFEKEMR